GGLSGNSGPPYQLAGRASGARHRCRFVLTCYANSTKCRGAEDHLPRPRERGGLGHKDRDVLYPRSKRIPCLAFAGILFWALVGGGCAFGPYTLERSHGRYNEAIRRVDEEQLLRNLVHMRYNEIPLNLNVSSIAAQYELAGGAETRPFFLAPNPSGGTFRTFTSVLPDVNVSGANRPTVPLLPADNGDAVRQFLTPISAETLIFLAQTSWPV